MSMLSIRSVFFALTLLPMVSHAFGSTDEWVSGTAMGVNEYVVNGAGQSNLNISCNAYGEKPISIHYTDAYGNTVSSYSGKTILLSIDGQDPYSVEESGSHAGDGNMKAAWRALRAGQYVTVYAEGAQPQSFTLNESARVLPKYGKSGCITAWDLND